MAIKRVTPIKKKQSQPIETSSSIEEQTKTFLEKGGVIDKIKPGVSGQELLTGRRHIRIS